MNGGHEQVPAEDLTPYVGKLIVHTYDGGLIFLSYFISFVGCWTTLELLHRRTSIHGHQNWYYLLAAASTMGSVSIWSMHFIGNQAVLMEPKSIHISYSPGFTAGSFFLPICGVIIAFYFISITEAVSVLGTLFGGFLAGSAICGMHYMGNGGISNFTLEYTWPFVFGSALIAVAASTVALGIFFYFKAHWTNSWRKRGSCAAILAVAVSGMHWVAAVGTQYRLKTDDSHSNSGLSRQATVGVVISLGIAACLALIAFAFIAQRSRQRSIDRAQQVVLASVIFDGEGKLMVTPEGLLPSRKITDKYAKLSFQEIFNVDHPVFCWCFRASRCWPGVTDLIPGIRDHLRNNKRARSPNSRGRMQTMAPSLAASEEIEYPTLFKELFLVAANDLANTIQEPLANLGVLYDDIMSTGNVKRSKYGPSLFTRTSVNSSINDISSLEKGVVPMVYGRGQVLFAVRQATKPEAARLAASGLCFASVPNIIELLSRSMEVSRHDLDLALSKMRTYVHTERVLDPGVHLGCFALRPLISRGFEVLVERDATNMLPTMPLHIGKLEQWQLDLLVQMDNWTVATCIKQLPVRVSCSNPREQEFAAILLDALKSLVTKIDNQFFQDARLIARPFDVPSRSGGAESGHASLITFRILASIHERTAIGERFVFGSLRFFFCQQHTHKDSKDNQIFSRKLHREFGNVGERAPMAEYMHSPLQRYSFYKPSRMYSPPPTGAHRGFRTWPSKLRSMHSHVTMRDGSSGNESEACDSRTSQDGLVQTPPPVLGGIKVSRDVNVNVSEIQRAGSSVDTEMANLGYFSEIGLDEEMETFAEKLVAITIDERRRTVV